MVQYPGSARVPPASTWQGKRRAAETAALPANIMMTFLLFALLAASPQQVNFADSGVFRILSNGQQIGTERFQIETTPTGCRARGEIRLKMPDGGEASETATLDLNRNLEVIRYERIQKSPKKASVNVVMDSDRARAHFRTPEGESDYEYFLERGFVILDTNFFHHYIFLLQHYDPSKGAGQHVSVFIPQEASPGMVVLESAGKDEGLDKWVAKTDTLEIHLWTDETRHLVKVTVPSANVEVVREGK